MGWRERELNVQTVETGRVAVDWDLSVEAVVSVGKEGVSERGRERERREREECTFLQTTGIVQAWASALE